MGNMTSMYNQTLHLGNFSLFKPDTSYSANYFAQMDLSGNYIAASIQLGAHIIKSKLYNGKFYLAKDSHGIYLSTGHTYYDFLEKRDINGNLIWDKQLPDVFTHDLSVANENNIYVCTQTGSGSNQKIRKYDSIGNLSWETYSQMFNYSIDSDSAGNCYVSGYGSGKIRKYQGNGMYSGNYYPPGQNISQIVYLDGDVIYSAGVSTDLSLVKYVNDTIAYDLLLGDYIVTSVLKVGSSVYVTGTETEDLNDGILIKISEDQTTSLQEVEDKVSLTIYPNPTQNIFRLDYNSVEKGDLTISIYNSFGQLVHTETEKNFQNEYRKELSLENYPTGMYQVEISQGAKKVVRKLIVD
jgi:hypothetical protein